MANPASTLRQRLYTVALNCYDLGFTAFGGAPVHFHILYDRFVKKLGWINDKTVCKFNTYHHQF
jgi:chromate transport protein ChrA